MDLTATYRVGAVLLILGSILAVAVNLAHPNPPDIGDPIAQLKLISTHHAWGNIHLGIVVADMIRLGGLVALADTFRDGYGRVWARIGMAGVIVGAAAALVLFAIDGIASQNLAKAWASAPEAERIIAYRVSQSNQYVGFGIYGLWILEMFGLSYICYGLAVAFSNAYPKWLGWIAVVFGGASFVVGYFQYFSGLTVLLTNILFPACAIVLSVWTVAMGVLLWRKAAA
jgi:hypothetical protein